MGRQQRKHERIEEQTMIKQTSRKLVQIGRGMVLCVGLAVVLAVTLGVTTTALAGTGVGDTFDLGKLNTVNRISSLVGSTSGAMLKVDNNGTGSAVSLQSNAGQAPLTVNSDAGTATNLSADKIDGKDSTEFLPVDTYSSQSPETSGVDIGNGTGIHHAEWSCDPGDELLTGGYRWMINATSVAVVGSWPSGNTWLVQWANTAAPNQPYEMQIYVKCADTAAPNHQ
jgi:hypothetical protein